MKKILSQLLLILLSLALLSGGCAASAPAGARLSEDIPLVVVGRPGLDIKIACIIAAYEMGYYDEEGVEVRFETISNLNDGVAALSAGKIDVLPFGVIPSATFISQGADVVIFGGTIALGSEGLTRPEQAERFADLAGFQGAVLACYRSETGHMALKGLLRDYGYSIGPLEEGADVEIIYLDSMASAAEAVSKGQADVAMLNSGYGYVAGQNGLTVAFHTGDMAPPFPCCRQSTSREALTDNFEGLVRFTIANLRGYRLLLTDKEAAVACLAAYSGQDPAYVENVIYGSADYRAAMVISLDPARNAVEDFYQLMKDNGDIDPDTPYDIADHIDVTVYQTALERLGREEPEEGLWAELLTDFQANNF